MDKSDIVSQLDELQFKSRNSPGFYELKTTLTTKKSKAAIILPDNKEKVVINRKN